MNFVTVKFPNNSSDTFEERWQEEMRSKAHVCKLALGADRWETGGCVLLRVVHEVVVG